MIAQFSLISQKQKIINAPSFSISKHKSTFSIFSQKQQHPRPIFELHKRTFTSFANAGFKLAPTFAKTTTPVPSFSFFSNINKKMMNFNLRGEKTCSKDLRKGDMLKHSGKIVQVLSTHFNKTAMRKAMVVLELKDIKTGKKWEETFRSVDELDAIDVEKPRCQVVSTSDDIVRVRIVDNPDEEVDVDASFFGSQLPYLKPDMEVWIVRIADDENAKVLSAEVDEHQEAVVESCDFVAKGSDKIRYKTATLTNGQKVQVPNFVEAGEAIIVNTTTGEYVKKVE